MNACWKVIGVFGDRSCDVLLQVAHCRNCRTYAAAGRLLLNRDAPEGFTEEWTARVAQEKERSASVLFAAVVFRLRDAWYALRTEALEEVMPDRPVQWVPHRSGGGILGVVNVHGELLLCVDMAVVMGLEEKGTERAAGRRRFMVCGGGHTGRFAFAADEIRGVVQVEEAQLQPAPATIGKAASTLVEQVILLGDETVGLLNDGRFFEQVEKMIRISERGTGGHTV
jgi:chemotaxis-related protein WspD